VLYRKFQHWIKWSEEVVVRELSYLVCCHMEQKKNRSWRCAFTIAPWTKSPSKIDILYQDWCLVTLVETIHWILHQARRQINLPSREYQSTLNKITIKNRYPLPRIDVLLDQLQQTTELFTKLDAKSTYHQGSIKEEDAWKT